MIRDHCNTMKGIARNILYRGRPSQNVVEAPTYSPFDAAYSLYKDDASRHVVTQRLGSANSAHTPRVAHQILEHASES